VVKNVYGDDKASKTTVRYGPLVSVISPDCNEFIECRLILSICTRNSCKIGASMFKT
jgi:hypothetical protein